MIKFIKFLFFSILFIALLAGALFITIVKNPPELSFNIGEGSRLTLPWGWTFSGHESYSYSVWPPEQYNFQKKSTFQKGECRIVVWNGRIFMQKQKDAFWIDYGEVIYGYEFSLNTEGNLVMDGKILKPIRKYKPKDKAPSNQALTLNAL